MKAEFEKLNPSIVWKYFYEITQIPRPSKREEKIIAYLENFAKEHNLEYAIDEIRNIVIRKPATKGYEHKPIVIFQSHVDMVCEKNNDVQHDFINEPIKAYIDGDWVKAQGTTLGADNGIGVAIQLALLADNTIEHGPIECLFTVDEETGLTGAFNLKRGFLKGNILINLDSEEDGIFYIGCAGGRDTTAQIAINTEPVPDGYVFYNLKVSKLKGGHSGGDIHLKRGNANQILTRFLSMYQKKLRIRLSFIDGGNLRNAIPREAFAIVGIPQDNQETFANLVKEFDSIIKKELYVSDPEVEISFIECNKPNSVFTLQSQKQLLNICYALPHGVMAMAQDMEDFVETSTNFASIKQKDNIITIATSQRSSLRSALENVCNKVASVFELGGAEYSTTDGYPGWTPNPKSKILEIAVNSWKNLFNTTPEFKAIHAGLECGLFSEKYPELDMISYGPTMQAVHSPDEKLFIPSVERIWRLTLEILKNVN